jgi:rhodanese-related sulfurtransferase
MKNRGARKTVMILTLLAAAWLAGPALGQEVRYVDRDTLKSWLGRPQVLVLDVRQPGAWEHSDQKIRGALREDPNEVAKWGPGLPKNNRIVVYCS